MGDPKKVAVNRVVRKRVVRKIQSALTHLVSEDFKYETILDTGTEWTIVGGPGWLVTQVMSVLSACLLWMSTWEM